MSVRAKKHLGQHFLIDRNICKKIAQQYTAHDNCKRVLEIGPGTGALTTYLLEDNPELHVIEVDRDSIAHLREHFPQLEGRIHEADFLRVDVHALMGSEPFGVVGNFPYNISSQILFKCLEHRNQVPEIMGMFQKEVALRVAEKPGSKQYGILSVLMQAFYDIHYCFTVDEHVFSPPPKVKSGVIRCVRNERKALDCDETHFIRVVKTCFNQRRKTIRNSIRPLVMGEMPDHPYLTLRPEVLSVDQFVELTQWVDSLRA